MQVFDFDKTLTYTDTLFGFYHHVARKKAFFHFKKGLIFFSAVLYKIGLISNDKLKSIGVFLFLKGCTQSELSKASQDYSKRIKLNGIYHSIYNQTNTSKKIIITASPEIYVQKVFPNDKIIGTKLAFNDNRVERLKINMFGQAKADYLISLGVTEIETLYTDSITDKPLMKMAKKVYLIKNGKIVNNV